MIVLQILKEQEAFKERMHRFVYSIVLIMIIINDYTVAMVSCYDQ